MDAQNNIPKILPVLNPANIGQEGALRYDSENEKANQHNKALEHQVWHYFLDSDPGSEEEKRWGKHLATIYLGATAMKVMTTPKDEETRKLQAEWLTQQSIEIYGQQDLGETTQLLNEDYDLFTSLEGSAHVDQHVLNELLGWYLELGVPSRVSESVKESTPESSSEYTIETLQSADVEFAQYLTNNFSRVIEIFQGRDLVTVEELEKGIEQILDEYSAINEGWNGWSVVLVNGGSMSVDTQKKTINIGRGRAPVPAEEAGVSVMHELADHVQRSVRGSEFDDEGLQYGLDDYLEFEEGLGCYMEYALTGRVPSKIANRQITASMALGQLGEGKEYDRNEIYQFLKLRTKVKMQADGVFSEELYSAKSEELRTLIIDRFFRGGLGVYPGKSVFTKDIVYGQGFSRARDFVRSQIERGANPDELFDFLLSGKFDPTISSHTKLLETKGKKIPLVDTA